MDRESEIKTDRMVDENVEKRECDEDMPASSRR